MSHSSHIARFLLTVAIVGATDLRADLPLDLFVTPPEQAAEEPRPDSRDLKAWDAKRQQDEAERIQKSQAMMKMIIKQGKELERMSTQDPGRKNQLTQEINKLQYEITKHFEQAQALNDTAQKAEYAAKQAEAGNAKKGSTLQTANLSGPGSKGEQGQDEKGEQVTKDQSPKDGATGDVADVLPDQAEFARKLEEVSGAPPVAGTEGTDAIGFNDEAKESTETKDPETLVSEAKSKFSERLNLLTPARAAAASAIGSEDIAISSDGKGDDLESKPVNDVALGSPRDPLDGVGKGPQLASLGKGVGAGGGTLLDLLRDNLASFANGAMEQLLAGSHVARGPASDSSRRETDGLEEDPETMPLAGNPPPNSNHALIAGSDRIRRNRISAVPAEAL